MIHFEPGAFVGAAPQLTYQLFIQLLAGAGYTVRVVSLSPEGACLCVQGGVSVPVAVALTAALSVA